GVLLCSISSFCKVISNFCRTLLHGSLSMMVMPVVSSSLCASGYLTLISSQTTLLRRQTLLIRLTQKTLMIRLIRHLTQFHHPIPVCHLTL
ncbi:hypothetical protein FOZ62_017273, partial [Perkinsus olseni]